MQAAGKSTLLRAIPPAIGTLEVDCLLTPYRPISEQEPWTSAARRCGAEAALRERLDRFALVVAEGPAAWPLFADIASELGSVVRHVYMKAFTYSGGELAWMDGEMMDWAVANVRSPYWADIVRHHATRPWEQADLILERVHEEPTPDSVFRELSGR